jgi:heme exporter protein D
MKTTPTADAQCGPRDGVFGLLVGISIIAIIAAWVVPVSSERRVNGGVQDRPASTARMNFGDNAPNVRLAKTEAGAGDFRSNVPPGKPIPSNPSGGDAPAEVGGAGRRASF